MKNKQKILRLVELSLLAALVVVLQLFGSFIKIGPLPMSLVLVPIVIGAILHGPKSGALLGGVFGVVTAVMGIIGVDAFSALLWTANPICFVLICLAKAIMAGFGAGLIYKALLKLTKGKAITAITVVACASAPVINTGLFAVGMFTCFFNTLTELPTMFPDAFGQFTDPVKLVFVGLAGFNFLGEFIVNLILSPAVVRIVDVIQKRLKH